MCVPGYFLDKIQCPSFLFLFFSFFQWCRRLWLSLYLKFFLPLASRMFISCLPVSFSFSPVLYLFFPACPEFTLLVPFSFSYFLEQV